MTQWAGERSVRRRTIVSAGGGLLVMAAAGAAGALGACRVPERLPHAVSREVLTLVPAHRLALTLADLPPGFQLADEMAPRLSATGLEDQWGRLSAYSVTFVPAAGAAVAEPVRRPGRSHEAGDVVSSVNAYASAEHAQAAFGAWKAAVPAAYRAAPVDLGIDPRDTAAYVNGRACLVGFRAGNVLASVRVDARWLPPVDPGDDEPAIALAAGLARRVIGHVLRGT